MNYVNHDPLGMLLTQHTKRSKALNIPYSLLDIVYSCCKRLFIWKVMNTYSRLFFPHIHIWPQVLYKNIDSLADEKSQRT